jgi:hypothetical protein
VSAAIIDPCQESKNWLHLVASFLALSCTLGNRASTNTNFFAGSVEKVAPLLLQPISSFRPKLWGEKLKQEFLTNLVVQLNKPTQSVPRLFGRYPRLLDTSQKRRPAKSMADPIHQPYSLEKTCTVFLEGLLNFGRIPDLVHRTSYAQHSLI